MHCPFCNEESFAKKKSVTEGWKIIGEIEVCALCGAELKKDPSGSVDAAEKSNASKSRLAALLGGDLSEKVTLCGSADRRFCRNCKYFLVHPFKTVCALSDQETDPMGECSRFEAAQ